MSYASQPTIIGTIFRTLGTYPSITRSVTYGWTDVTIKVNMVGGQTRPGSDINMGEFNNYRPKISHIYLINLIHNRQKHRFQINMDAYTLDKLYLHHSNPLLLYQYLTTTKILLHNLFSSLIFVTCTCSS